MHPNVYLAQCRALLVDHSTPLPLLIFYYSKIMGCIILLLFQVRLSQFRFVPQGQKRAPDSYYLISCKYFFSVSIIYLAVNLKKKIRFPLAMLLADTIDFDFFLGHTKLLQYDIQNIYIHYILRPCWQVFSLNIFCQLLVTRL